MPYNLPTAAAASSLKGHNCIVKRRSKENSFTRERGRERERERERGERGRGGGRVRIHVERERESER